MSGVPAGLIGIPSLEWMYTRAVESLLRLRIPGGSACCILDSTMPVPAKRNELVNRMLLHPGGLQWLLMIDADMTPPPDIVDVLWDAGADIVSPLYFQREPPHECVCGSFVGDDRYSFSRLDQLGGDAVSVEWVGAGCMMVRRKVLERMECPWFYYGSDYRQSMVAEDMAFCRDAGHAGFAMTVLPYVQIGHVSARKVTDKDYWSYHKLAEAGTPEQE